MNRAVKRVMLMNHRLHIHTNEAHIIINRIEDIDRRRSIRLFSYLKATMMMTTIKGIISVKCRLVQINIILMFIVHIRKRMMMTRIPIRVQIHILAVMINRMLMYQLVHFLLAIYPNRIIEGDVVEVIQRAVQKVTQKAVPHHVAIREADQGVDRLAVQRVHIQGQHPVNHDPSK